MMPFDHSQFWNSFSTHFGGFLLPPPSTLLTTCGINWAKQKLGMHFFICIFAISFWIARWTWAQQSRLTRAIARIHSAKRITYHHIRLLHSTYICNIAKSLLTAAVFFGFSLCFRLYAFNLWCQNYMTIILGIAYQKCFKGLFRSPPICLQKYFKNVFVVL